MAGDAAPLARKLGVRAGLRLLALDPPAGFRDSLAPLPEGAEVAEEPAAGGTFDVVVGFVAARAEVAETAETARAVLADGGVLWLAYPKGGSGVETDLSRDRGWEPLGDAGWRPVSNVAVDEVWSALRFRPESEVGTRGTHPRSV